MKFHRIEHTENIIRSHNRIIIITKHRREEEEKKIDLRFKNDEIQQQKI